MTKAKYATNILPVHYVLLSLKSTQFFERTCHYQTLCFRAHKGNYTVLAKHSTSKYYGRVLVLSWNVFNFIFRNYFYSVL